MCFSAEARDLAHQLASLIRVFCGIPAKQAWAFACCLSFRPTSFQRCSETKQQNSTKALPCGGSKARHAIAYTYNIAYFRMDKPFLRYFSQLPPYRAIPKKPKREQCRCESHTLIFSRLYSQFPKLMQPCPQTLGAFEQQPSNLERS